MHVYNKYIKVYMLCENHIGDKHLFGFILPKNNKVNFVEWREFAKCFASLLTSRRVRHIFKVLIRVE